jgi:nitroreductase
MEVSEAIRTKRAVRRFKDQPLPEDAIKAILNAGRRAPTAGNKQYFTFIAIRDKALQEQIGAIRQGARHVATAPFVVVIAADTSGMSDWLVSFDTGQLVTYMMLEAWSMGIGSNVANLGTESPIGQILNLPEGIHSEWAISFGYPADDAGTSAPMKPGGRKSLDEVVRWSKW